MIIIYHNNISVTEVTLEEKTISFNTKVISKMLLEIAVAYPNELLIWCHVDLRFSLNYAKLSDIFHHQKIMMSYTATDQNYISPTIGYVEESPFIKINKKVSYPTWQMSSCVGGIYASVLNVFENKINADTNFDYFLNSVAKLGMIKGLFCYSEPQLLVKDYQKINSIQANDFIVFKFVSQHYKKRWLLLLLINLVLFEKRFPILPFLFSVLFKDRKKIKLNLDIIEVESTLKIVDKKSIDVIIPTIGRKQYLYDVLQDLAKQTHLPEKVIVVEQNSLENSVTELDYIKKEKWPFIIKHVFTHQLGACNARNVALAEVTSEWIFLNDDDNRLEDNLIENVFLKAAQYGTEAIITAYLQPHEIQQYNTTHQSGIFGSGNSFVKKSAVENIRFDKALEFGYGEDTDFGLQLRNQGKDVIYFPDLKITHLKAPIGGFRTKIKKEWVSDSIQPKPSPTVLYVLQKHYTVQQLKSYKLVLLLKLLKKESFSNYWIFYKAFKCKWNRSRYWANQL